MPGSQLACYERRPVFSSDKMCRDSPTHMDQLRNSSKVNTPFRSPQGWTEPLMGEDERNSLPTSLQAGQRYFKLLCSHLPTMKPLPLHGRAQMRTTRKQVKGHTCTIVLLGL